MTLSSKLHKQAGQVQYAVLDVTDNGKPFHAGNCDTSGVGVPRRYAQSTSGRSSSTVT